MANAKVGGTWRTVKLPYARVSGQWKPCKQMYAKVGGVWKITFDITAADPFDGTGSLDGQLTPGYAPWEVISGTWTESGGNVSSSDTSDRVAALETGLTDVEVEIDRTTAATGGDGVAFWIQDQSNWWGVRAYTEEYFVPFTNFTYYPFNCTDSFRTRNITQNPSVPGTAIPGTNNIASPGNVVTPGNVSAFGTCTNTTGCTGTCCFTPVPSTPVPGSNNIVNSGTFVSCNYSLSYFSMITNRNTFLATISTRTCSCSGNSNSNCSLSFGSGGNNCINGCGPTNYPGPSPFPCNRNPDNRSFATRISGCGSGCGPACGPICGASPSPSNVNSIFQLFCPNASSYNNFSFNNANCSCAYGVSATKANFTNNPPNYNAPNNNPASNNAPRFNNPPSFNTPTNNVPNYNPPNNNTPTPASCTCTDGPITNSNYLSFISSNVSFPVCANNIPCSSTQPTGTLYSRSCVACPVGSPSCITSFSGANAAYYKRGQIIRKSGGTLNVITNQDFGDVGNVYAYTSGNTIGFRQYSATGRAGTSSNLVTYDAGPINKGTKHGIIVTAVPYTQSYSISRFKVNV